MSEENKNNAQQIKKFFEIVKHGIKHAGEQAVKFDKDLSKKIQKVEEATKEVVKHVEKIAE